MGKIIPRKIDALIGEKAARHNKVFNGLVSLAEIFSPQEFELFCEFIPEGHALWKQFRNARRESKHPKTFGWLEFALQVLKAHELDIITPKSCKLSREEKSVSVRRASTNLRVLGSATILAAHREEPHAVSQVSRFLCRGCVQTTCTHWFGWQSFPKGQVS